MATFACLRLAATAIVLALFTADALAVDVTKGSTNDKDKKGTDSHVSVERSVSRDSPNSSSPATAPSPPRDPGNRPAPGPTGGSRPAAMTPALNAPAMQPRFSGPSPAVQDNWRDRSDRDREDREREDREREDRQRREREEEQRAIYAGPNGYVNGTGTLIGTGAGLLRVEANGANWIVRPDVNAAKQLTGTAGPDFLRPGMVVKFQAAFDPNGNDKDKAIAPLTDLEIITPHAGETIGAVPAGAGAKQNAPQPAAARSFVVIGSIKSYKQKELTVSTGSRVFKAELDSAPQIKVRMSDFQFARAGDQVQLTGYAVRSGYIVASQILITMAAPLGDPLAEFGKEKTANRPVKLATGQK